MPDYEQLRHEREQIDAGARALRSRAISDGYAGLERKAVAFSFALVLDGQPVGAENRVVSSDQRLLGQPTSWSRSASRAA